MSFREKIAWTCLVTTVAVFIPYFAYMYMLFDRGELRASSVITVFIGAVVFQTVLGIVAAIVFAIRSPREHADERDRAIASKSITVSYFVLISSSFAAVGCVYFFAISGARAGDFLATTLMSQALLLCLVVAESTRYFIQAVSYRRGS